MRAKEGEEIPYYTNEWSRKAREISRRRTLVHLHCRLQGYFLTTASAQSLAPRRVYTVVIHVYKWL